MSQIYNDELLRKRPALIGSTCFSGINRMSQIYSVEFNWHLCFTKTGYHE